MPSNAVVIDANVLYSIEVTDLLLTMAAARIHLMRTGTLEPNLGILAPEYGYADISELVALKRDGTEHGPLPSQLDVHHRQRWAELDAALTDAEANSRLPVESENVAEIEAWLVAARCDDFGRPER